MLIKNKDKYHILQPLILSCLLGIGMVIGFNLNSETRLIEKISSDDSGVSIGRVEEVIRFIEHKYVDDIDSDKLIESSITHILDQLDPHSNYITEADLIDVNQQMKQSYEGLGIETLNDQDTLVVMNVIPDSPAEKSGIKQFDKIVSINDEALFQEQMNYDEISNFLAGKHGKKLSFTVVNSLGEKRNSKIELGVVDIPSTATGIILKDSIAYIKINRFNASSYKDFSFELEDLLEGQNKYHIILDLRQNPGGYLPETSKILSQLFKEKNKLLVYTKGRNDQKQEYKSNGNTFFNLDKVTVLVDKGSASGSEILAGAIQDWDRGLIIGERTYGKGLVQEQFDLNNGGALRLTIARYYTPSGRSIQKPFANGELNQVDTNQYFSLELNRPLASQQGINPDIKVSSSTDCYRLLDRSIIDVVYQIVKSKNWHREMPSIENIERLDKEEIHSMIKQNIKNDTQLPITYNKSDPCFSSLVFEIKYQLIKLLKNEKQAMKSLVGEDEFVEIALEEMEKKSLFVEKI